MSPESDIAPNLLVQARERAIKEGASIKFEEGDAEDLPYQTGTFDLVVTMFGAMFAPRPEIVANELCRVCRRGGEIAIASWTPTGFIGELFRVTGKHVAPPPGTPSPLLWGDEAVVRARLRGNVTNIKTTKISDPSEPSLHGSGNRRVLPAPLWSHSQSICGSRRGRPVRASPRSGGVVSPPQRGG